MAENGSATKAGGDVARSTDPAQSTRTRYHHGDLRESLIEATRQLVIEKGAENFTLADACRVAGVSTAAPYKHFADRNEILKIVCERSFEALADRASDAAKAAGEGTLDAVIALNVAYIDMAIEQPALFRLMFGQNPEIKRDEAVLFVGRTCFQKVLGQMALYCEHNGLKEDPLAVFMRTWTFTHGVASLVIDGDYEAVVPGFDYEAMLKRTTPMLLIDQAA